MSSFPVRLCLLVCLVLPSACAVHAPAATAPAATMVPAGPMTPQAGPSQPPWVAPVYLAGTRIDAIALLGPPPPEGSEAAGRDLEGVLAAQLAARQAGTRARAIADADVSCTRFADALGDAAGSAGAQPALQFATTTALQASTVIGAAKAYWHRPRPFLVSDRVERLADVAPGAAPDSPALDARDHSSYPSGHAAFGLACAIVLAQLVPEQRTALFARARSYAESREIVGAHFPSDIEAGRLAAAAAMAAIQQNPGFQQELLEIRPGLRRALGLAPMPRALATPSADTR